MSRTLSPYLALRGIFLSREKIVGKAEKRCVWYYKLTCIKLLLTSHSSSSYKLFGLHYKMTYFCLPFYVLRSKLYIGVTI